MAAALWALGAVCLGISLFVPRYRPIGEMRGGGDTVLRTSLSGPKSPRESDFAGASIPPDLLPERLRKHWIDDARMYRVHLLPFALRAKTQASREELLGRHFLDISGPDGKTETSAASTGAVAEAFGQRLRIGHHRAWEGLVADPGGTAAARFSWRTRKGAWRGPVLLQQGETFWESPFTLAFDSFETDPEAKDPRIPILQPRWGVLDDGHMHWFESFVPGTGLKLDSGERIAIVSGSPPGPIRVQRGPHPPQTLNANMQHFGGVFRYEAPGYHSPAVALHLWPGGAVAHVRYQGKNQTPQPWKEGQTLALPLPGADPELRLDELRRSATAVRAVDSPFQELEVAIGEGQALFLREGEPHILAGDIALVYRREPLQDVTYELAWAVPRKHCETSWEPFAQVAPGEPAHHGGYRFTVLHPDSRMPETTRLRVDQQQHRRWGWGAAGVVLCAAAYALGRIGRRNPARTEGPAADST